MAEKPFETAHVLELDAIAGPGSLVWRPIRRRFGIEAFGMNAYTADAGNDVVEDHTEESYRHQEVYFVASGRATFTVAGERIDAPAGTFVFIRDFTVRRQAVADEDGTIVVAVGGRAGEPFRESGWEYSFAAQPHLDAGDYDRAVEVASEGSSVIPTTPASSTTWPVLRHSPGDARLRSNICAARTSSPPRRCRGGRRTIRISIRSATTPRSRSNPQPTS